MDVSSVGDEIAFVPGLELSRRLFVEAVEPLLQHRLSGLRLGDGHLGRGSDVLGFDTPQSRDHDWGPQVTLFVGEADDSAQLVADIERVLADERPSK